MGGAGIQRAPHVQGAALHAGQQHDGAVVVFDGLRLNHAGVVDRILQQASCRLCGQQHLAAVSLDQATVLDKRVHGALVHDDIEQAVSGHVQGHGVASGKRHRAELGRDDALVADVGTQQCNIAAVGMERALVENRAIADPGEPVVAGHEITVGDAQRGGDQPAHVHLCALTEQDAMRVYQEHFAVRRQLTQNARRVRAQHPIEHDRVAVGLNKMD